VPSLEVGEVVKVVGEVRRRRTLPERSSKRQAGVWRRFHTLGVVLACGVSGAFKG